MQTKETHEKIIEFLKRAGPSLPVHIAREAAMDTLFTGAFLSELYNDKEIKMSHMKIGNSALYFLAGQEPMLEKFAGYLPPKEKEACILLKKNGVLEDSRQLPAIRVALRSIKDFAVALKIDDSLFWKYFTLEEVPGSLIKAARSQKPAHEALAKFKQQGVAAPNAEEKSELQAEPQAEIYLPVSKSAVQLPAPAPEKPASALESKAEQAKKKKAAAVEIFLNEVKRFISKKNVALAKIEEFDAKQVIASIILNGENCLLIAYNKKRLDEKDLMAAYKKSLRSGLPYFVISKGDMPKKVKEAIVAYKKLAGFEKIESS